MSETSDIQDSKESALMKHLRDIGKATSVPLISILLAIIFGTFVLIIMATNPVIAYSNMIVGTLTPKKIADTLFNSTPLILTGLSVAVAFRGGMFNIGTEGQVIFGGFLCALVGYGLQDFFGISFPFFIMIPLLMIVGMIGGAFWAFIPAILKAKRGVHEVITTIMMNYIALTLMVFFVGDLSAPFIDRDYGGNSSPQTPKIAQSGWIPSIAKSVLDLISIIIDNFLGPLGWILDPIKGFFQSFSTSFLHWGFFISLIACVVVFIILWRTKLGYNTRAVGLNRSAAKYGGINVTRNIVYVMLISGALAGLAGSLEVMGYWHRFIYGFSTGFGFDGIAVALIGGNHPFGVIFGGILLGWLKSGGQVLQLAGIPKDMANTLKGLIVFFVAVPMISKEVINYYEKTRTESGKNIGKSLNNIIAKYEKIFIFIIATTGLVVVLLIHNTLDSVIPTLGAQFELLDLFLLLNLAISILFLVFIFIGYKYVKIRRNISHTQYLFALLLAILGVTIFIKSIGLFGQDLTFFGLILVVFCFILSQEYLARRKLVKSSNEEKITELEYDDIQIKRKNIQIYAVSAILFLIGTFVLLFINFEPNLNNISINIDLFFFVLDRLGKFIGLIGTFVLLGSIFLLRRIEIPRNHYIKYTFYFSAIFFEFIAIATIFSLDPILLFTMTLPIATPIGLAALGGMFSEKSGVVNIGLEGMMLTGAFVAVWISELTGDPWVGVFGAVVAGGLMGSLHAIASIRFRANQVVVGVAINMLASALTTLGIIAVWNVRGTSPNVTGLDNITFGFLVDIGTFASDFFHIDIFRGTAVILYELLGGSSGYSPIVYLFIVLIFVTWWIIQRTSFGLRVRAVGEHPRAADTLGVNVYKMRYVCVILSGILAALGGAQLTVGFVPIFGRNMTTGRGFVALAALIFGGWSPIGAALASFLFAFAYAFRFQLESLGIEWLLPIQGLDAGGLFIQNLTPTIPFLVTIIVVAAVAKKMRPPAADGIPYIKEG